MDTDWGDVMKQFMLTVAMGKRLLGKAIAIHPAITSALRHGTVVIVAGTTNGYVAEEILNAIGQKDNFTRKRFFRGITLPPNYRVTDAGRLADENEFRDDVVINDGIRQEGKTINDVAVNLKEGDVIIKGGNALDLIHKRAAVLIGNPQGGTITAALPAIIGRRVRLMIPIGLEKRIFGDLDQIANKVNSPGTKGYRLLPIQGEVVTEIEALMLLTGVKAEMMAAGGVCGAEGGIWLIIEGSTEQVLETEKILESVSSEPPFMI
jgi:6-phosphogluconate dehydrogenase (decarboxylating)